MASKIVNTEKAALMARLGIENLVHALQRDSFLVCTATIASQKYSGLVRLGWKPLKLVTEDMVAR